MNTNKLPDRGMLDMLSRRMSTQFQLPAVYDDALSYQGLIYKLMQYIQDTIQNVSDWNDWLEDFVSTFDTRFHDTVRTMIQELYDSGQLAELTAQVIDAVQDQIDELDDNINDVSIRVRDILVNVKDFGAIGDGVADDTVSIQNAIDYASSVNKNVFIPSGVYMIHAVGDGDSTMAPHSASSNYNGGLIMKSNVKLLGESTVSSVLKCIPNNSPHYTMIQIVNCSNVAIQDIGLVGDVDTHEDVVGEWGHGVFVTHSKNVVLKNLTIKDMWGDGIYLGVLYGNYLSTQNYNILIEDVVIDKCSRNGISLCSCESLNVNRVTITNIDRTAPKAGIDIEPEGYGDTNPIIKDITLRDVFTSQNLYGITIFLTSEGLNWENVNIYNYKSYRDKAHAIFVGRLSDLDMTGNISFFDVEVFEAGWSGVVLSDYLSNSPKLLFDRVTIIDPNGADHILDNPAGWYNGSAFVVSYNPALGEKYNKPFGNITVKNFNSTDTRTTTKTNVAFHVYQPSNMPENIKFINPIRMDAIRDGRMHGVVVEDPHKILTLNHPYYEFGWNHLPWTRVLSSGTEADYRFFFVSDIAKIADNNSVELVVDGDNGVRIDMGEINRNAVYPISDGGSRYITSSVKGSAITITKINGQLFATRITGEWTQS